MTPALYKKSSVWLSIAFVVIIQKWVITHACFDKHIHEINFLYALSIFWILIERFFRVNHTSYILMLSSNMKLLLLDEVKINLLKWSYFKQKYHKVVICLLKVTNFIISSCSKLSKTNIPFFCMYFFLIWWLRPYWEYLLLLIKVFEKENRCYKDFWKFNQISLKTRNWEKVNPWKDL